MDEADRDNSPDDPSIPQTPQKADNESLPVEVLADLLGSGDFPVQVDDPEAAAEIILKRLADAGFKVVEGPIAGMREVRRLRADVDRLQEAKRRALQIADERAKEAVELRRQIETLKGGAR
jgi:hypothetical protein